VTSGNEQLALFLAHSLELESEAGERYRELEEVMRGHNNIAVADFFLRMAREAEKHRAEVQSLAGELVLPVIKPWEFNWLDEEPPETASYEAVHYRMSLREAVSLALANERAAKRYYALAAQQSEDRQTAEAAAGFAAEEGEHEAALVAMLQALPNTAVLHRLEDDEPNMPE
jgi:rubrerythrin